MKRIWLFRRKPTTCACRCGKLNGEQLAKAVIDATVFDSVLRDVTNSLKYR